MPHETEQLACDFMYVHDEIVQKVRQEMPDEDVLFDLNELFKVFGDSTRIRILYCLFASEMCVCDIATLLNMTQSAISHQLSVLKKKQAGQKPSRRQNHFLLAGRQPRPRHSGSGRGACDGIS